MRYFVFIAFVLSLGLLRGASYLPVSELSEVREASGVFVGTPVGGEVVEQEGRLWTRWLFEVEEVLKGTFVSEVVVRHRGGVAKDRVEWEGDAPVFVVGERYLLCVGDGAFDDAQLCLGGRSVRALVCVGKTLDLEASLCVRRFRKLIDGDTGGLFPRARFPMKVAEGDATLFRQEFASVTGSGLSEFRIPPDEPSRPIRFTRADLGEAIPYVVDIDVLPEGLTDDEALAAVERALAVWHEVTGIRFVSRRVASFGQAAGDVDSSEQELWIQLHDLYDRIQNESTLGIGGASATNGGLPNGGSGGRVYATEYHLATRGYVVLDHTKAAMSDLTTFEEVLCHELGHALGMAHSSESENEVDAAKRDAVMYFRTHSDGRGASLRAWDVATIQKSYPPGNLPPQGAEGFLDVVTLPDGLETSQPQVNEIEVVGADKDTDSKDLMLSMVEPTSMMNGTFSLIGNRLGFAPAGLFDVDFAYPIESPRFYDRATLRFDDGTHASPPFGVRVLSFQSDTSPDGNGDGLPNRWVAAHFAGVDPNPTGDADGDGLTNVAEFMQRTDPNAAGSTVRVGFETSALSLDEGAVVLAPVSVTGGVPFRSVVLPVSVAGASDDVSVSSELLIPAGKTSGFVVLRVLSDAVEEPDEAVTVALGVPSSGLATLGQATLALTIKGVVGSAKALAEIGSVALDGDGALRFAWRGESGEGYVIERSGDLEEWAMVEALTGTGVWGEVVVPVGDANELVFFRVR